MWCVVVLTARQIASPQDVMDLFLQSEALRWSYSPTTFIDKWDVKTRQQVGKNTSKVWSLFCTVLHVLLNCRNTSGRAFCPQTPCVIYYRATCREDRWPGGWQCLCLLGWKQWRFCVKREVHLAASVHTYWLKRTMKDNIACRVSSWLTPTSAH